MDRHLWKMSKYAAHKSALLRELLKHRETSEMWHVNVRLCNVFDAIWRLRVGVRKANKKETKKADFKGFFNYELQAEQKEDAKRYLEDDVEIGIAIEESLASGYKITLSRNTQNDTYQASMQCYDVDSPNAGLVMSAFGKHWYLALGVLMFKHTKCLNKTWDDNSDNDLIADFG